MAEAGTMPRTFSDYLTRQHEARSTAVPINPADVVWWVQYDGTPEQHSRIADVLCETLCLALADGVDPADAFIRSPTNDVLPEPADYIVFDRYAQLAVVRYDDWWLFWTPAEGQSPH